MVYIYKGEEHDGDYKWRKTGIGDLLLPGTLG